MNILGIIVWPKEEACATWLDWQRIHRAERRVIGAAKGARIQQREEQVANHEHLRDEEGELYGPGIAD